MMMPSMRLFLAILVASCAVVPSARIAAQGPAASPLVIRNVRLVDVRTGIIHPAMSVLLRGDTIVQVSRERLDIGDARVLDGSNKYLIPGLIDTHVHLFAGFYNWPDSSAQLGWILASGVTTVRDAGPGRLEATYVGFRKAIDAGQLIGPRILISGMLWRVTEVTGALTVGDALREFPRLGLHQVKVRGLDPDSTLDLIRAARASGYTVFGHTNWGFRDSTVEFALDAIDAGINGLSHTSGKNAGGRKLDRNLRGWLSPDTVWTRRLIAKAVAKNVWLEPTLTVTYADNSLVYGQCTAGFDVDRIHEYFPYHNAPQKSTSSAVADTARRICANHWRFLRDFHDAGGMIIAGSDFVPVAPLGVVEEMRLLVAAGLTPLVALQAATVNAAKALNLPNAIGAVEVGKRADLLLLDGNPLEDITAVRRISTIIARGQVVDAATLWARKGTNPPMMSNDKQLDRIDPAIQRFAAQRPSTIIDVVIHTDGTQMPQDLGHALIRQVISYSPTLVRVRATAADVTWMSRARFVVRIEFEQPASHIR